MTNATITASFVASFSSVGISDGSGYLSWGTSQRFQVTGLTSIGNIPTDTQSTTWYGGITTLSSVSIAFPATVSVGDQFALPAVGDRINLLYITPFGSGGGSVM